MESEQLPYHEGFAYWGVPQFAVFVDSTTGALVAELRGRRNNGLVTATDVFVTMTLSPVDAVRGYQKRWEVILRRNPDMTPLEASHHALKRWWYAWHISKLLADP